MDTMQERTIHSLSPEQTAAAAANLGQACKGGEVIVLSSDLGGGKTTFVKGLARGMGSRDMVRSPSFTIGNRYDAGNLSLYHYDFYRLDDPGILQAELAEVLDDPGVVVAVEWADVITSVLPDNHLLITIKADGELSRKLHFYYPQNYKYLFDKVSS